MPEFNYIVRNKDGIRQEGVIEAKNINLSLSALGNVIAA